MGDYVNTCLTSCSILLIFPERHLISLRIWWSRVYCLPSHPPWNHTKTVLMFAIIYFFTPAQHRHPLYLKQRAIRIPGKCIYEWLHMFIFCLPCPPPHQHHHRNYYYYHHQHQQATMLDIPARTNSSDQHHIVMESVCYDFPRAPNRIILQMKICIFTSECVPAHPLAQSQQRAFVRNSC